MAETLQLPSFDNCKVSVMLTCMAETLVTKSHAFDSARLLAVIEVFLRFEMSLGHANMHE